VYIDELKHVQILNNDDEEIGSVYSRTPRCWCQT
jgi:hypothetical protein